MFLDGFIDKLMPKDIIQQILAGRYPRQLKSIIKLMDITRKIRYYRNGGKFRGIKNIEWLTEYDIKSESFDFHSKKDGISMYARLRNAGDFIVQSVESNIWYVDEIILMENGWSTDDTVEKCRMLADKYPTKIRFFIYEPEVYKLFSEEHKSCPNNSVHNFSYASNYLLSKVSYKYACKLDDDHLGIAPMIKILSQDISSNWLNNFLITPLINIQKEHQLFVIASDNYRSSFAWLFGDFWFHPMCHNIYFHSNAYTEWYLHNLSSRLSPLSFLHLKLLKATKWLHNYHHHGHEYLKNYYGSEQFQPLEQQYIDLLHSYGINEDR